MGERPTRELERAIDSAELGIAKETVRGSREISLGLALRQLLLAAEPETYDDRALRWLVRWATETPDATVAQAAEIARALIYVRSDASALEVISALTESDGRG